MKESPEKKSLGHAHAFLDSLIENLPLMVFVKDVSELRFIRFNKAGQELLGYSAEELLGKNDFDFFPRDQAEFFVSKDRAVLAGNQIVDIPEEPIMTKRGLRYLHTRKIPLFNAQGQAEYLLGISEDITDKKAAEGERLRLIREEAVNRERTESIRRSELLADASVAMVSTMDYHEALKSLAKVIVPGLADWCTISLLKEDKSFERVAVHHRSPEKKPLLERLENVSPFRAGGSEGIAKVLATGKPSIDSPVSEEAIVAGTVSEEHFRLLKEIGLHSRMSVPIRIRDQVIGALTLFNSEPGRLFVYEDLLLAEEIGRRSGMSIENSLLYDSAKKAIEARDEFLSIASHELKTPITSLRLQLQLAQRGMQKGNSSPEKMGRSLEVSLAQVERLTRLVEDLLDVSRIQAGKISFNFEPENLSDLVNDVIERYSDPLKAAACLVKLEIQAGVMAEVDRVRFEQVLVNLISNVIKYAPGKELKVELKQEGEWAKITVADRGPGIPADRLPRIFERFERAVVGRNISGLGLGLFITERMVQAHGGKIEAKSQLGEGTQFYVNLPIRQKAKKSSA